VDTLSFQKHHEMIKKMSKTICTVLIKYLNATEAIFPPGTFFSMQFVTGISGFGIFFFLEIKVV